MLLSLDIIDTSPPFMFTFDRRPPRRWGFQEVMTYEGVGVCINTDMLKPAGTSTSSVPAAVMGHHPQQRILVSKADKLSATNAAMMNTQSSGQNPVHAAPGTVQSSPEPTGQLGGPAVPIQVTQRQRRGLIGILLLRERRILFLQHDVQ